jgi:hypothetical protein
MVGRTLLAVAALAAAGVAGTLAQARGAPDARAGERAQAAQMQDPRQGIRNARAAGIRVDPAVEDMMARAPIGSCANDPSQDTCPPARAIVYAGEREPDADGWSSYGDGDTAATALTAAIPQCAIRVSDASPYKAAGFAQMNAANQCFATVTSHELYGSLWKFYSGKWFHMDTDSARGVGGTTIRVHARYDCTATPLRAWRARGEGYALLRGTWYAETQERYKNLRCG